MIHTKILPDSLPKTLNGLYHLHAPRPILDDVDYANTAELIDRLALLPKRTRDQEDYLEVLTLLVEKHDRDTLDKLRAAGDALAILQYLMEGHQMNASDLGRVLGSRTLGPAILRGVRKISRANAQVLAEHFKVDPSLFFQV